MRNINILSEDYIQIECAYGGIECRVNDKLEHLREAIDTEISKFSKSAMDTSDYMNLRYSPIFEGLTNFKYTAKLTELARRISSGTSMPLEESTLISYAIKENNAQPYTNDVFDGVYCFGNVNECDVTCGNDGEYAVSYTHNGKMNLLKELADMRNNVANAYNNLKSVDPHTIQEALYTLANVYMTLN